MLPVRGAGRNVELPGLRSGGQHRKVLSQVRRTRGNMGLLCLRHIGEYGKILPEMWSGKPRAGNGHRAGARVSNVKKFGGAGCDGGHYRSSAREN